MTTATLIHKAFEETPVTVAEVFIGDWTGTKALEYVFRATQNIEGSWSRGATIEFDGEVMENGDYDDNVTVLVDLPVSKRTGQVMGLRSTSVGDQIVMGGKTYEVAFSGFKEVV